jgi:hypothetical protein
MGTWAMGINNNDTVVGYYVNYVYGLPDSAEYYYHGFVYSNGNYTEIDSPSATTTPYFKQTRNIDGSLTITRYNAGTRPMSINDNGDIVGYYNNLEGITTGFLYTNGGYFDIFDPNAELVTGSGWGCHLYSINDGDEIIGTYEDSKQITHGFIYNSGNYTTIDATTWNFPSSASSITSVYVTNINNLGNILGSYSVTNNINEQYFIGTPSPINGICGSSNGQVTGTAPTTDLCASGVASSTSGSGPWTWTCSGVYGGTTTSCSASPPATNGACGISNGGSFTSVPTANLCMSGVASLVSGSGPWTWTCSGEYGGTTASCSASLTAQPVNAACGSSNGGSFTSVPTANLCMSGVASLVSGSGPWTWTCSGEYGGTTASCSASLTAQPVNAACGSSNGGSFTSVPTANLCSAGTPSSVSEPVPGSSPWTWTCSGAYGGTTASCMTAPPITSPNLWQGASNLGNEWDYLGWFGYFNAGFFSGTSGWIYHDTLGWLYAEGTSTDNIWFYDLQWDNGQGSWWWTNSSIYPWIYNANDGKWYYYDTKSTVNKRWFGTSSGQWATH